MTREEAGRRETQESHRVGDHVPVQAGSAENLGSMSAAASPTERESPAVEKTMRKAEKQADIATPLNKSWSEDEAEKPDRTLKTTEDSRATMTLPVVSETSESRESSRVETRALSPPDEAEEEIETRAAPPNSIPGLRKVSPSTVASATDREDDTSVSSPQTCPMDFEAETEDDEYHSKHDTGREEEISTKPPRIGSDLIQPHTPLEDSMFRSLDQRPQGSGGAS